MAVYNSRNISFFFFLIIPCASPLYFKLSSIRPQDTNLSIRVTGTAYITEAGIQVTPNERNVSLGGKTGRATYIPPLHLRDKASEILTDFTTHFSFAIDSSGNFSYADGLAFFLALVGSNIPENAIDTYPNIWDPNSTHVRININSMESVSIAIWLNNIKQGRKNDAWISYNSSSKSLKVVFTTGFSDYRILNDNLNYVVNLRDYLPKWVILGFLAVTGDLFEKNNIKTWEFNSSLNVDTDIRNPTPIPNPAPSTVITGEKKNKTGPVVGLFVGMSVVVGVGLALVGYGLWKKRKAKEQDELVFESSMDDQLEKGSESKKFSYVELVMLGFCGV